MLSVAQHLGYCSPTFAYPNGGAEDYDERAAAAITAAGGNGGLTMREGLNSARTPAFELRRPNGALVGGTDAGVSYRALSTVRTYAIQTPDVGLWQVSLQGGARFTLRVFGSSPLRINGLRFLAPSEPRPRPEVDIAINPGQPVASSHLVAQARLTRPAGSAVMRLVRRDGSPLLEPATTLSEGRRLQASVTMPTEEYMFEVTGQTVAGHAFMRQLPTAAVPRTVALRANPILTSVMQGQSATIAVTVTNASRVPATYSMSAASSLRWPSSVPGPFTVGPGASVTVNVTVNVPLDAPVGTFNDLTLTAHDPASASARNSIAVIIQVTSATSGCMDVRLSDFNLFLLANYSQGTDVRGKVAAGGNISLNHFSVGASVPDGRTALTLVAGGNLSLANGGVHGDAWYGGSYSGGSSVTFSRGTASHGTPVDFAAREAELRRLSSYLAAMAVNGTTVRESWGGLMLRGTNPGVNVFEVDAAAFTGANLLSVEAPAGSLVVINIHGPSARLAGLGHSFSGGIDQRGVLYNFVDATAISAQGVGIWGTVLAPDADIQFSNGSFDGGIFARSLTGNAEGHINPLTDRTLCE